MRMSMSFNSDVSVNNGYQLQLNKVSAPTVSSSSTYGNGSSNQVIMSNGTTVFWGSCPRIVKSEELGAKATITATLENYHNYFLSIARSATSNGYFAILAPNGILNAIAANSNYTVTISNRSLSVKNETSTAVQLTLIEL